jgi:hypothetical protein
MGAPWNCRTRRLPCAIGRIPEKRDFPGLFCAKARKGHFFPIYPDALLDISWTTSSKAATRRSNGPGASSSACSTAASPPALCRAPLRRRVTGRIDSPFARELSGLVVSPSRRDVLWTHNDSGDSARLLAVTTAGGTVAEVVLAGAENVDWEDIAIGPRGSLLVGDIGDNAAMRASMTVWRVPEPTASGTVAATRYELRYADGPHDAETLLFDRRARAIVIVTKSFDGRAGVYVARRPSPQRVRTLRRAGALALGGGEAVTAGDVAPDGRTIALRTYDSAFVWRRRTGETVAAALRGRPCRARVALAGEGEGEALALTRDGGALLTVAEGPRPPLRRYEPSGGASGR